MNFQLSPERLKLQSAARELARGQIQARAAEIDRSEEYPWDNVARLKEAGFFGMTLPTEYGGRGLSYLDAVLVIDEMARVCGITGRIVVEANMGAIGAIMRYGTEAQKKLAAALVLDGDKPAICITEPGAGSAASEMTTRAEKRGDTYVLNGRKHWITGAGISRLHLVFARVFDEAGEEQGIGGFIAIRGETKGLRIGRREPAMGLRGLPEAEVIFEDMEVPAASLVVPPRGLRKGFADLMDAYNAQRVGAAAVALGIAEGAYDAALEYAGIRKQFGKPIGSFQGVHFQLADMALEIEAGTHLLYHAAWLKQNGKPFKKEAAMAKLFCSELAMRATTKAVQIFGGYGYTTEYPVERMMRDAKVCEIGEGTSEIQRMVIARQILGDVVG
ncbi:MAG TPA: acyl-CoA dehydrogenase family protein [Gemmatimonadales bacterium]|nr:acyl-CoA dehydrogenase family protein [Gemmatimonadales bacterium]